jgi:hypothetical protein
MINRDEMIKDDIKDDVHDMVGKLNLYKTWTKEKHQIKNQLIELLDKKKYISFYSLVSRFIVTSIGSSYLYDVPAKKRGHLSIFRNKRVRIICVSSGRFWRIYMAGIV